MLFHILHRFRHKYFIFDGLLSSYVASWFVSFWAVWMLICVLVAFLCVYHPLSVSPIL